MAISDSSQRVALVPRSSSIHTKARSHGESMTILRILRPIGDGYVTVTCQEYENAWRGLCLLAQIGLPGMRRALHGGSIPLGWRSRTVVSALR
jgi:hypothetical protein